LWHYGVAQSSFKSLIHLFELTSVLVQHNVVSKIINKNVFMVKLSNFSWQTHVNMHIRVHFVHGCHIQGYAWVIHVQLITRCYASFVTYIFHVLLNMLCLHTLVEDDWSLWVVVLCALFFPFRDWPGFTFGIVSGRLRKSWLKECEDIAYLDVPEK
jgi:hypothetical protein